MKQLNEYLINKQTKEKSKIPTPREFKSYPDFDSFCDGLYDKWKSVVRFYLVPTPNLGKTKYRIYFYLPDSGFDIETCEGGIYLEMYTDRVSLYQAPQDSYYQNIEISKDGILRLIKGKYYDTMVCEWMDTKMGKGTLMRCADDSIDYIYRILELIKEDD